MSADGPLMTVDAHVVVVGQRYWYVEPYYCAMRHTKAQRHWVTMWRTSREGRLFVDEGQACALLLAEARARLDKARGEVRREEKNVKRIKARLTVMEGP